MVGLSRVLFPIVALLGASGVIVGILNSYERFTVPALTPIFWNLAIIAALVVGVPQAEQRHLEALRVRGRRARRHRDPGAAAGAVARASRRQPARRARLARPGRAARVRADAPGRARARADQLQPRRRHVLRRPLPRPAARAERDRRRLSHLHAPAGDLLRRDRDRALPVPLAPRHQGRQRRLPRDRLARRPPDRLHARPGQRDRGGALDPDRARPLRARRLRGGGDDGRRPRPRRVPDRAHVQRDDADAEPGVLQPPGAVGADVGRAREPVRERRARLRVLPARDLGAAARDRGRQHRRVRRPVRDPAPAPRPARLARDRRLLRADRARSRPPPPASPGASTPPSTGRSGERSGRRSSPSAAAVAAAALAYLVLARLLGIRELGALLSLVGRSGTRSGGHPA